MYKEYRIHPAIGIARLGDSDEYYIGPESPGIVPLGSGPYKVGGKIKRQGARFRVYEYVFNDNGNISAVQEITNKEATINWDVTLRNKKAASQKFPPRGILRNGHIQVERHRLIVRGHSTITGPTQPKQLVAGTFMGIPVDLGHILTDEKGRLIILGGFGKSFSTDGRGPSNDFNNDNWCDDTSDGSVNATIQFPDGTKIDNVIRAWVICAPPDFAPPIENIVTLYDTVFQVATELDSSLMVQPKISFRNHIFPLLRRVVNLQWVSPSARKNHGQGEKWNFLEATYLKNLAKKREPPDKYRKPVFKALRSPYPGDPNNEGIMPNLKRGIDPENPPNKTYSTVTPYQYEMMREWMEGNFIADWKGKPPIPVPFESLPPKEQPSALDRAALEACVSVPFWPGIESGYKISRLDTYDQPFRISNNLEPGDLTADLAIPWQSDFEACSLLWWPGQRPNQIIRNNKEGAEWIHGISDMVKQWSLLGFIVQEGTRYMEKERSQTLNSP